MCVKRISFFKTCFTNYSYTTFFSYFQGKTHPCYTRAYYQKIKFMCHIFLFFDTIAERLSAEAASGHIDARIVDAAHLLADKTYGDEVDPSELTPRERRRLERAKLAVREYRRRMLELYARDEAQDDDGR
ncbi:MAG: hypothetical protein BHV61_03905 [Collinsella sp. 60_9]|nr:MAG: hypothetical protein BHV61_03905 [Collinsella sp. 60_9]